MGKKHTATCGEIITARGPWREILLVCRKCGGKLKGGFGPKRKDELPDAFRELLRQAGRRREVRILEVGCLGVCPKGGITVMQGTRPGEMLVVPEGMDLTQLAARLSGPAASDAAMPVPAAALQD